MEIKDVLIILFPLASGFVSAYLTYFFTIKSKKSEAMLKFKEEKYSSLLIDLQGFMTFNKSTEKKRNFLKSAINYGFIVQMRSMRR